MQECQILLVFGVDKSRSQYYSSLKDFCRSSDPTRYVIAAEQLFDSLDQLYQAAKLLTIWIWIFKTQDGSLCGIFSDQETMGRKRKS